MTMHSDQGGESRPSSVRKQIASGAADTVKQTAEAQGQPPSTAQGQQPTHRAA